MLKRKVDDQSTDCFQDVWIKVLSDMNMITNYRITINKRISKKLFYMIFKFGHPVKSGIWPVNAFPSSHLLQGKRILDYLFLCTYNNVTRISNFGYVLIMYMIIYTYNSSKPVNLVKSKGMLPVMFLLDNFLHWRVE